MTINFISCKDSNEIRTIHTKTNNIEIMMGNESDKIIDELFESLLQRYQEGLEEEMRGSEFALYSIDLLHYNLQEINLKGSPKWLKNKKATINPINNDDKCFQYAITIALNYQKKKKKGATKNIKS